LDVRTQVLTEAGYRCAVPTCRQILALDIHHLVQVSEGGGNEPANLIALCPSCHALHHRGVIAIDSLRVWKGMLVSLSQAFDTQAIDDLVFLSKLRPRELGISGDGVLRYSRLVAAGLAGFRLISQNGPLVLYEVFLTPKGAALVDSWKEGNMAALTTSLESAE
jgi:hypothetical protein